MSRLQVERHWREWNKCLVSYFERFRELEGAGILDASSNVDLFCLHATFVPEIRDVQARHFRGVTFQNKRKLTKDPAYPAGTHGGATCT